MRYLAVFALLIAAAASHAQEAAKKADGNRLAYLDELDPYYPNRQFPKLITPQWVGDKDVECVVILGIDDMKDPRRYEAFLRPILRRLKEIDGRAPVSIMTCAVDPKDPQLQAWLKEGLSLECHTYDHPCPFFKGGFDKAKQTYDKCVDLMHAVPNNKPVAFRMPCCDSLNTPSPRFWAEIFNKITPWPQGSEGKQGGNFLSIDSSVFNVFTSDDPDLPRELVLDAKGQERFKRYLPADRSFVNTIENYPYPYVIGRLCWEFPCMTPSDWQAQHLQKPNNPRTVEDWKAALDCAVIKKGVFCLVFHPHGWIKNDQVVEFIDHAVAKHGKKVKFLTFKEALERLEKNLLAGERWRNISQTLRIEVKLHDANDDGLLDITIFKGKFNRQGMWSAEGKWKWSEERTIKVPANFPGFSNSDHFVGFPLRLKAASNLTFLCSNKIRQAVLMSAPEKSNDIVQTPFSLPDGAFVCDKGGKDAGLRLLDLNGDRNDDLIFSNEKEYGVYLFTDMEKGWSRKIMAGKRGDKDALPMISRNGTNNGFWVHSGHLWWSNEDTVLLKDHVERRSIQELLKGKPAEK